ncbi:MAG TPA: hypothetical protein VEV45_07490 [Streptosporangiaceae bacterium]|nr:hypothetical protein [Streptosporangiaceae bacterium]
MQALSALTPPLLVGAVVIVAIVAFLRHEMRRSRTNRSAPGPEGDVPTAMSSAAPDKDRDKLTNVSPAAADDSGRRRDA